MCAEVATTQWSQVLAARDGSDTQARAALESLCQTYWQPLYAYIRAQGHGPDEARDLTQGFFAEFLEKDFLASVDPEKGRFRAFLLASLRHFLANERRRERALKRGGGTHTLSLDTDAAEEGYEIQSNGELTPLEVYEQRWATAVLERAMTRLRRESAASGDTSEFEILKQYLTSAEPQMPYREVAETLATTEGAVTTAVHRLRQRYGRCLRAEIAETVADPAETDDELRHLLARVRSKPSAEP
jgi:RNA polymerase sigma-70 factor (ECF subfamily)